MPFEVLENPLTGERVVIRLASSSAPGGPAVGDLYLRPGAAVVGEHRHPHMTETFTVVRGRVGLRVAGHEREAGPGTRISVPPGVAHDWWNAGDEPAWVVVEVTPAGRFITMIRNLFFLAADGKTDPDGRPSLLQSALLGREFSDTIQFTRPPRPLQRMIFGLLSPVARWRGYRGSYPEYERRTSGTVEGLEPLPAEIAALLPAGIPGAAGTDEPDTESADDSGPATANRSGRR